MNSKKYRFYIVVDCDNRPMTYQRQSTKGGQFVYCSSERHQSPLPLHVYSYKTARELIARTYKFRTDSGIDVFKKDETLYLMPVKKFHNQKLKINKSNLIPNSHEQEETAAAQDS